MSVELEFKSLKPNNLVYTKDSDYKRISAYDLYELDLIQLSLGYKPIPINEKTLKDVDLVCLGKKRNWFDFDNYGIPHFSINTDGRPSQYIHTWVNLKKIKYIHELENLVYVLFDIELKLKEEK